MNGWEKFNLALDRNQKSKDTQEFFEFFGSKTFLGAN